MSSDLPAIRHRIGAAAPARAVYDALTTIDGLARWWTTDTTGDAAPGGKVTFRFGGPDRFFTMEVLAAVPDERVEWRVVDGPDEWIGTTVTFDLTHTAASDASGVRSTNPGETVIMFTHADWREVVPFLHHCSSKWCVYLLSLRDAVEGRPAQPYPHDVHVSSWD